MNDVDVTCDGCGASSPASVRNTSHTSVAVAMPYSWRVWGYPSAPNTVMCPACVALDIPNVNEPTIGVTAACDHCDAHSDPLAVSHTFPDTLYLDLPPGWRMDVNAAGDGYDVLCPDHAAASREITT